MKSKKSRGPKGGGTIRKRPDGLWEGRFTAGYNPETGKPVQKSIYGKSQEEVQEKLTEKLHELHIGIYQEPTKMTLGEWIDIWFDEYAAVSVSAYTADSYRSIKDRHIKPILGHFKLSALTPLQIQRFYNTMTDQKKLSPKTVKNIHGVLHKSLDKAVRLGYIRTNPTDSCELPKMYKEEIHPMEEEEIERFLQAIKNEKYGNIYWVTLFTGMRQGEVLGLTWDCVDFKRNKIFVNKQLKKTQKVKGEYILDKTKNRRSRMLTVAPAVMAMLEKQKLEQEQMAEAAGPLWNNEMNLVFTNEFGKHLCHFTVYKHYKKIVEEIGIPESRFHDLRHSYAVVALESGDDIKTVQGNLGHATASFTLDIYGHVSQKMRQDSADRMEKYIQNAEKTEANG